MTINDCSSGIVGLKVLYSDITFMQITTVHWHFSKLKKPKNSYQINTNEYEVLKNIWNIQTNIAFQYPVIITFHTPFS